MTVLKYELAHLNLTLEVERLLLSIYFDLCFTQIFGYI